jgi:hypothetical protein
VWLLCPTHRSVTYAFAPYLGSQGRRIGHQRADDDCGRKPKDLRKSLPPTSAAKRETTFVPKLNVVWLLCPTHLPLLSTPWADKGGGQATKESSTMVAET